MRTAALRSQVAASVDLPVRLLPHLARIFEPLDSLGSMPRPVVAMLREAGISRKNRVLDLACGKGAVAIAVARGLGCVVHGVDAFAPFVEAAERAADRRGVAATCLFRIGDVGLWERRRVRVRYDGAMMLGLYPCDRAARVLRRWVRPGGVYIIDDAFEGNGMAGGVGELPTLDECRSAIERRGDRIEQEFVPTAAQMAQLNAGLYARLRGACAELEAERPRLRADLREFLSRQRAANRLLNGPVRSAVWLVRRAK